MENQNTTSNSSAYGGEGWIPRKLSMKQDIGKIWSNCGISNEWSTLKAVLLHKPGNELAESQNPNAVQMLEPINLDRAKQQHDLLAQMYKEIGISVFYVDPTDTPPPNQLFVADQIFSTPEGIILSRLASDIRAGEEKSTAQCLLKNGIPVIRTISGDATFEGADAMWLNSKTVLLALGFRTNNKGASQVTSVLEEMGVKVIKTRIPSGAMHLMGILRIVDKNLAIAWPGRLDSATIKKMEELNYNVVFIPDINEALLGSALNFVTLGKRKILMPSKNPVTQKFFEELGITCYTVDIDEISKAAGAIGCLTGVLHREN